jgi:thioredoxin-related protein
MVKRLLAVFFLSGFIYCSHAQAPVTKPSLYQPGEDAGKAIAAAIKQAMAENKHVLIQAGGNWCSWCIEFNRFCSADFQLDSLLKKDFVVCHLNYSKENYNKPLFARYGYAQRFGFPVFIVLDEHGNRIHTQNSSYLEKDKSYDKEKVMEFFESWNRKALDPAVYINF